MFEAQYDNRGSKALEKKLRRLARGADRQQRRALYRGLKAARTIAAKLLRQRFGIPSRVTKQSLSRVTMRDGEIGAKRLPIPVEQLGSRALKRGRKVKVRKWVGDSGAGPRTFEPAWQTRRGRFRSTHKNPDGYRLVGRSVARVWVGILPDISQRARVVYERAMADWFNRP